MKTSKRILAVLLLLAMVFSLAACGKGNDNPSISKKEEGETAIRNGEVGSMGEITNLNLCSFNDESELIVALEINQFLSYGFDDKNGSYYLMNSFVAEKDTAFFVPLTQEVELDYSGETQYLSVALNGEEILRLAPSMDSEPSLIKFQPKTMSEAGNWQAGDYTFTAQIGDSSVTRTTSFYAAKKIKVLAVPVLANYGGEIVDVDGTWQSSISFTKATYPLGNNDLEYVFAPALDLSGEEYDLRGDDECMYNVWAALSNLQTPNKDYEFILGFVRDRQGADATLEGYTYGLPASIITESSGDMLATVAHEVAHGYQIGDEYPGGSLNLDKNQPPYNMEGSNYNDRAATILGDKPFVQGGNDVGIAATGAVIIPDQHAYDFRTNSLRGTVTTYMGSFSPNMDEYWTSSSLWELLYVVYIGDMGNIYGAGVSPDGTTASGSSEAGEAPSQQAEETPHYTCSSCSTASQLSEDMIFIECQNCYTLNPVSGDGTCGECGEALEANDQLAYIACPVCGEFTPYIEAMQSQQTGKGAAPSMKQGDPVDVMAIDIKGTVKEDGTVTLEPSYVYEATTADLSPSSKGGYSAKMLDKDGKVIISQSFEPSFWTQSNPPKKIDTAPFSLTLRYPQETAAIALFKGETELHRIKVSANAPVVEITGLKDYDTVSDDYTLNWKSSDADGDELFFEIWYCPAEDEFYNIASNVKGNSYKLNLSEYPGSDEGYFYIFATDGVNTTGIDSPYIKVPFKAPTIITKQAAPAQFKITDEIMLEAEIYDLQDGWLYEDDSVEWKSENGASFISGSWFIAFPFELAPGTHTFTVTATNSQGMEASSNFTFEIIDDDSALPTGWSRDEVKEALSIGLTVPLKGITGAINRLQYSNLLFTVLAVLDPELEYVDYVDGVVTDCGADDYAQFLLVDLGIMDAPNGKFSPLGTVTQKEALEMMARVLSAAYGQEYTAEEIASEFTEYEIFGGAKENDYKADEKLSKELALIRAYRTILTYMPEE